MTKQSGVHWHCANRDCGWSAVLVTLPEDQGTTPMCLCGNPLQKSELAPVFSCLDFLRGEELPENEDLRDTD